MSANKNNWMVTVDGAEAPRTFDTRTQARAWVKELKANGIKGKIVDLREHEVTEPVCDEPTGIDPVEGTDPRDGSGHHDENPQTEPDAYTPDAIAEAKAELAANPDAYIGFEGIGEPTDDDARQFIDMTHTGIVPAPRIEEGDNGISPLQEKLVEEHQAEADRRGAEIFNLGAGSTDTGIYSKTSQGGLGSEIDPATMEVTHEWLDGDDGAEDQDAEGDDGRPFTEPSPVSSSLSSRTSSPMLSDRQVQITSLIEGSNFSLDGRRGVYLGIVGGDAKVEFDGRTGIWSGATVVKPESALVEVAPEHADSVERVAKPAFGQAKVLIFGHAPTSILRLLGKLDLGYGVEQATTLLAKHGVVGLSPSTIKIQLRAGAKGERGEPATLTQEQVDQLLS